MNRSDLKEGVVLVDADCWMVRVDSVHDGCVQISAWLDHQDDAVSSTHFVEHFLAIVEDRKMVKL